MSGKIKWDASFYFMCILSILGGYYTEWLIYFATIIIHECGHLLMAFFKKWKLEELKIYGFGGLMTYEQELNCSISDDLWVSSGGILANGLVLILLQFTPSSWLDIQGLRIYDLTVQAQIFVILLNLIPLPPLDGYRLGLDLASFKIPYYKVLKWGMWMSFGILMIIGLITLKYNIRQNWFIMGFLLIKTVEFAKQRRYLFNRFILQKHLQQNLKLQDKRVEVKGTRWEEYLYKGVNNNLIIRQRAYKEQELLKIKYKA